MPAGSSPRPDVEASPRRSTLLSDRYRLDTVLGQGGVGTVWQARDLQLDRDVAVKVLQPGVASDPVAADRFRREATTAASLSHASLVTIYDVGEDDGVVYLVMELVDGPSTRDVLDAVGPLEPGEVTALGHRVAGALAVVHARGLVHRDVKPGNVLLPVDGPPKVVDFGTVHVLGEGAATLTTPGTMMGTIGYVAPEQFDGHEVTPRADVYAVGLLLHECLTGRPTFGEGTIAELMRRRLDQDATPPSRHRDGIPPELDEIIVRATLRDPAQRFADASALMAALEPLVPGDGDGRLRALARQHPRPRLAVTAPLPDTDDEPDTPSDTPRPAPPEAHEATTVLPRQDDAPPQAPPRDDPSRRASVDDEPTQRFTPPVVPPGPLVPPGTPVGSGRADTHEDAEATSVLPTTPASGTPDDAEPQDRPRRRPPLIPVLLGLGALALAVAGAVVVLGGSSPSGGGGDAGGNGSGSGGDTSAVQIVGGQDLDPFGDREHPEDIGRAFDGDPSTAWLTQIYNASSLDKPGVGMWVQAADGSAPRHASIDLAIPGANVEVYALDGPPPGDPAAWGDPVTDAAGASGTLEADLPEGTDVVLVWFTSVGNDAGGHRGGVSEIRLTS